MNNQLQSTIHDSGNSDVDITIQIDMVSLAYMYACSLYATKQINEQQLEKMIQKYHELMNRRERRDAFDVETPVKRLEPPRKL